jgi:hypothetical protein
MPLKVNNFATYADMELFLRGGIKSGPSPSTLKGKVFGLHGLTLVFASPVAETVTFADATGVGLDLKAVLAQIIAGTTGVIPRFKDGALELVETIPASGMSLNLQTSTALTAFGWSGEQAVGSTHTGIVYNATDGAAPRYLDWTGTADAAGYLVLTEEA